MIPGVIGELNKCGFIGVVERKLDWSDSKKVGDEVEAESID